MNILTKIIDVFKAKNPAMYTKIVTGLWLLQGLLLSSISLSEGVVNEIPLLTTYLPDLSAFLESLPLKLSGTLSVITGILTTLVGSSTPGSQVPIKLLETQKIGKQVIEGGTITFVKKSVADKLQKEHSATKLPMT